jgi:F-type H+-transporting ATPase subunit alpha
MMDVKISTSDIRKALDGFIKNFNTDAVQMDEVGHVSASGDGIAHVVGLPSARASELLRFEDGTLGLAMNLDEREIGVVVLGDFEGIDEGQEVRRTGKVLSVPVGDGYLGRVVDAMGNPVDGLGKIKTEGNRVLEAQAPGVMDRKSVFEPLHTGIKAVDTMTPIGRGQRQLIIGDRQTGKTAIAIDTIINQKSDWETGDPTKQVRCIYVAIGQKGTTISSVKAALEDADAMKYTTIISAPASDSAGFKYLAAYTGSAIGQHWMYNGKHVLIIFDDLSKQSDAYRSVSLLLRRPPGREAYPGDVFYLHSRLLERCAKLSDELGGGSMTGLPIVETKANDVSAYIPTNVISITDGQIFLQSDLFNANQRPAVDVGISVSRVGGAAQTKAMKKVAGTLKIELAKYRSLESFAMFASDLDAASKAQLARGERLTELLKQQQYDPFSFDKQVVMVWAGLNGKLDDVPVAEIRHFENEFLGYLDSMTDILTKIRATEDLNENIYAALEEAIENFKSTFVSGDKKFLTKILVEDEGIDVIQAKITPKPAEKKHFSHKTTTSNDTTRKKVVPKKQQDKKPAKSVVNVKKTSPASNEQKKTDIAIDASVPKRKGRPLGAKNKPRSVVNAEDKSEPKRRGRPPGAKNKPKEVN